MSERTLREIVDELRGEGALDEDEHQTLVRELDACQRAGDAMEALKNMMEAWDSLPIGYYTPDQIQQWLNSKKLKHAVQAAKDLLRRVS